MQPRQRRRDRLARRRALAHFLGDEMRDGFGVGLGREDMALGGQLLAQFAEILDDAVMDDGDLVVGVRMGVVFGRPAMRRPARVAEADMAVERLRRRVSLRDCAACRWRAAASACRFPASRRPPNHSRDIQAASALP